LIPHGDSPNGQSRAKDGCAEAIRLLSRAVELDPGLARAWTSLGLAYLVAALNGFIDDPAAARASWRLCTRKALKLDPADFLVRACTGDTRAQDGDRAGAVVGYELALASAPNHADNLALLAGSFALCAGDPRRGVELA
jgi:Flp pilus assembly protein TadD